VPARTMIPLTWIRKNVSRWRKEIPEQAPAKVTLFPMRVFNPKIRRQDDYAVRGFMEDTRERRRKDSVWI